MTEISEMFIKETSRLTGGQRTIIVLKTTLITISTSQAAVHYAEEFSSARIWRNRLLFGNRGNNP